MKAEVQEVYQEFRINF